MQEQNIIQEEEIDLRDLFKTIFDKKKFILIVTFLITILSIIYVLAKTPIYQVKSNVQIGYIGDKLLVEPKILEKTLNIVFNVEHKDPDRKEFVSEVTNISLVKKLDDFIKITTNGISNEEALKKNKEVVEYIKKSYEKKINRFKISTNLEIEKVKKQIEYIEGYETENLKLQIDKLENQKIFEIDKEIKKIKTQDIKEYKNKIKKLKTITLIDLEKEIKKVKEQEVKKLNDKIKFLKTQTLVTVDNEIKFLKKISIPSIKNKIELHKSKLKKYNLSIKELYSKFDGLQNPVISIQMVNYQNLILNSENNIENLKVQFEKIINKEIPQLENKQKNIEERDIPNILTDIENIKKFKLYNLERKKEDILKEEIPKLYTEIENIEKFKIYELERSKTDISNEQLKKLQYKLHIEFKNKIENYLNKIKELENNMSSLNVANSKVIGDYQLNNGPIKPKKSLIVVVSFVTGLILSIFLVFFMNFIQSFRKEETKND